MMVMVVPVQAVVASLMETFIAALPTSTGIPVAMIVSSCVALLEVEDATAISIVR